MALSSFWQCGDLYQLDPLTLADLGRASWGGRFPSDVGVSAHARVDEHSGELLVFNSATAAPYLHFATVDARGRLTRYEPVELPGPRLPHDLAFTERFAVLNDLPLFWDRELLERGLYATRFHPDLPSRLGLLPRDGSGPVRWFEVEPTYVLHWANAYEDGDEVVVDGFYQRRPEPADAPAGGPPQRIFRFLAADVLATTLHRWRINTVTGATKEEHLTDRFSEFGMINGRHRGRRHRHVYATVNRPGWFLMTGVVHHDTDTGAMFDAARLADGPVASVRLPERVSSGTHSFWAPASDLPGW